MITSVRCGMQWFLLSGLTTIQAYPANAMTNVNNMVYLILVLKIGGPSGHFDFGPFFVYFFPLVFKIWYFSYFLGILFMFSDDFIQSPYQIGLITKNLDLKISGK